jgi:hypothetical protein
LDTAAPKEAESQPAPVDTIEQKKEEVVAAFGDFGKSVSSRFGSWWSEK